VKRLFCLLIGVLLLAGCTVDFTDTRRLGRVDSTSVQSVGGKTVRLVYVAGSEYALDISDDVGAGDMVYRTTYHTRNAAPAFPALCKHGFRKGQFKHDWKEGGVKRSGKNPDLCFRIKVASQ
jgi:hypothetical protein